MNVKRQADALKEHPFLEGFRQEDVQKMAELAVEVQFGRDEIIFREGQESGLFYLILSGRVALEASAPGRVFRVQTLGPGDELGWWPGASTFRGGLSNP